MTKTTKVPRFVPRTLEATIKKYVKLPEILAIVGPRRSGKTTFLEHLMTSLSRCQYLSFENEVTLDLFDRDIDTFAARYLAKNQFLILDEFQHAKHGGKHLKYLFDAFPGKKMIISGSSSPDITIHALRFLTGRCLVFTLLPFSFEELLRTKPPLPTEREYRRYAAEYITFGGYPEIVLQPDPEVKKTLLQNIYSLFFAREVKDLSTLTDDYKLKNLLKALALAPGHLVEYRALMELSGFDFPSVKRYLNFLDKTFIAFPVFPFFTNRRTELVKNPKFYFYDLGLRNSLIDNFLPLDERPDKGALVENFIAIRLKETGGGLRFWRTKNKAEVDFIFEKGGRRTAIEVKAGPERNIPSGLASFVQKYAPHQAFVVSSTSTMTRIAGNTTARFVPYWKPHDMVKRL